MNIALINITNGKQNITAETLTLTVNFLKGQPAEGDFVFLKDGYFTVYAYPIRKIGQLSSEHQYELTLYFPEKNSVYWARIEEQITEKDSIAFCGISFESYHLFDLDQRLAYLFRISAFLGNDEIAEFIKSNYRLANKIVPKEREGEAGLTKLGGLPVAHPGFQFPKDRNGLSSLFIGQLYINDFNQGSRSTQEFKNDGVLYFFGTIVRQDDLYSFGDIIVTYSEEVENVVEIALPDDLASFGNLKEQDLITAEEINIPPLESSLWTGPSMSKAENDSYLYIQEILREYGYVDSIKLLGHPNQIQGCVLLEAELKDKNLLWFGSHYADNKNEVSQIINDNIPECRDWRLLLEFEGNVFTELSNLKNNFNNYMDGRYYVMIRQGDLDSMNFTNTVTVYQVT